ncbi:UDP-glucose/GDP-mannose dehydrogenase family protein [Paenibacillus hunanensis]|uniref:UDP-glucose dehydrogenase family protein n=1 Tax=Paenibacillus hunanensis TaxID=539262 RepID=UPI002026D2DE|nr:UDP-glucose/GDP-mannose dehydrogenase family protein [Paenibacillus hunanensis]MCL9662777.1 UDP-glucose/GDP-mannose dehydrogenase family protein [Paenibacillus hunanensis]
MKITVIGTGYVGLVTGVVLSDLGHQVTCLDIDKQKINLLKQGISPIYEPGLEELINKNIQRQLISFTIDKQEAFSTAEVIFIAVGTPQSEQGAADLSYVEQAVKDIASTVDHDVIVVMKSTVPIGTGDWVENTLHSHKSSNINFYIVSNPEFLREGFALQDSYNGDRIVIGAQEEHAGNTVQALFNGLKVPVIRTNRRSAEMIKYASNAFLAVKISYINEIANLCEKLDVNVLEVADGMGADRRIGRSFLNPGIGYGGSCFPKDTEAIAYLGREHNAPLTIVESTIKANQRQRELFFEKVIDYFGGVLKGKTIGLLGLAFKPNTDDLREAPSLYLIEQLKRHGATVKAYDPIVKHLEECVDSIEEATQAVDAILLVTEWKEFVNLDIEDTKIFDGRYVLKPQGMYSIL